MTDDQTRAQERTWALYQLERTGASDEQARLVLGLLERWWDGAETVDGEGKDMAAVEMFERLARGQALPIRPDLVAPAWRWEQARPGALVVRDYVRVKFDAYEGETGRLHNGRSGPIVRISMGDVLVQYDDTDEPLRGLPPRHSPHKLEKRFIA